MAEEKKSRTPEEQEQAFKSWLQKKTLKDTTFAYLERLDPVHAVEEGNLKQVAVALRAAQQVLGNMMVQSCAGQSQPLVDVVLCLSRCYGLHQLV